MKSSVILSSLQFIMFTLFRYSLKKSQAGIRASIINTLHISDARLEDSGEVQCRDVNEIFTDYATATVKVTRNEANKRRHICC